MMEQITILLPEPCSREHFAAQLYPFCTGGHARRQMNELIDLYRLRPLLRELGLTPRSRLLTPQMQLIIYAAYSDARQRSANGAALQGRT